MVIFLGHVRRGTAGGAAWAKGGPSAAENVRSGLHFFEDHLSLPMQTSVTEVVAAAAPSSASPVLTPDPLLPWDPEWFMWGWERRY